MILVDTGPLVALFEPQDAQHAHCRAVLRTLREPLMTTVAGLVVVGNPLCSVRL